MLLGLFAKNVSATSFNLFAGNPEIRSTSSGVYSATRVLSLLNREFEFSIQSDNTTLLTIRIETYYHPRELPLE